MLDKLVTGQLTFKSLKPCDLSCCSKSDIKAYFENTYNLNESLFTSLRDESALYKCPDRLRLPLIFYYGHTACVYMNKLILAGFVEPEERINVKFETLFETGVDEMSWDDAENYRMGGKFQWPAVDDVISFRRSVRELISKKIEITPLQLPITMDSPWWALMMGMEHERIHFETSSVLIRQLPIECVSRPVGWNYAPLEHAQRPVRNEMLLVDKREVHIGKPVDFPSYGWDNEYGSLRVSVPSFEASKYPVTNGEFFQFVTAGGYERPEFWSKEGWNWVTFCQARHPMFWVCCKGCKSRSAGDLVTYSHCRQQSMDPGAGERTNGRADHMDDHDGRIATKAQEHLTNGQNGYCNGHSNVDGNGHQGSDEGGGHSAYRLRCMFDVVGMQWSWPVEVNYHEARAFCAWKGAEYRLITEAEHHALRGPTMSITQGSACDAIFRDDFDANINLRVGSSTPVDQYPANALGFHDVFGNVWQWTEDHFNGLPGFNTHCLYDDFSSPCFDARHNVIMGGSWISTGDEASRFARFAFRRHFLQHAGFRVARSVALSNNMKTAMPARFVATPVYVLGAGIQDNSDSLDHMSTECEHEDSTNTQYLWETEERVYRMLHDEYSSPDCPLANVCENWLDKYAVSRRRALYVGCDTGRVVFAMASCFAEVVAQDFSGRLIDVCCRLQQGKTVSYVIDDVSNVTSLSKSHMDVTNVIFKQFTWIPNEVGFHDFILCTLLNRAQNVKAWIVRLHEVLNKLGLLVISSQPPWDEQSLLPLLQQHFKLMDATVVGNPPEARVTAWQHK